MKKYYPIPGWECYGISKCAEIIRLTANCRGAVANRVLKQHLHKTRGYLVVRLYNKKSKTFDVHKLMGLTFLGMTKDGQQICHNNGIRTDCRLENLRIDTASNNQKDRVLHGTTNRGSNHTSSIYSESLIKEIKIKLKNGIRPPALSKEYQISENYIRNIKNGYKWKWVEV
jgi:hypothetical protein